VNILLITFFYAPEPGAPQARLRAQVGGLVARGHRVHVLTTMPNYPLGRPFAAYRRKVFQVERLEDCAVYRVWSFSISTLTPAMRLLKYLTFVLAGLAALVWMRLSGRRYERIVVESPPVFTCILGTVAALLWRAIHIIQVSDLWVDLLPEFGILRAGSLAFKAALAVERLLLESSHHIVTVTNGCRAALETKVRQRIPVTVITNGADLSVYSAPSDRNAIRAECGWEERLVCTYAGNLGYIHGLAALVETAEAVSDDDVFHFVVIGDGVFKSRIEALILEKGLKNVELRPSVPEAILAGLLCASDVGLVFLDGTERARDAISVKTFSYMACGLPVVGCCGGRTRQIVEEHEAGILADPGCGVELASILRRVAGDVERRARLGVNARAAVKQFDRAELAKRFSVIVENDTASHSGHTSSDTGRRLHSQAPYPAPVGSRGDSGQSAAVMCAAKESWRKRAFDLVLSLPALMLMSPLLLLVAIAVKMSSRGSVFYRDRRVGRGGKEFLLWKFRSMVTGANRMGWNITVEGDPRITPLGRFLRHWKIDELPNLLNVLVGEMSIVGPRPEVPEYTQYYTPSQRRILTIRPGITDLATSSVYRHEQTILAQVPEPKAFYINNVMPEKLRLNLALVDEPYSAWRDLRLVVRTFAAILAAKLVGVRAST
jgi:lipopolysaccharide/colanic/teichoic acid biosynthesis glycosyltransferase/glycosyltransferase involved in cell wall biosynthesis